MKVNYLISALTTLLTISFSSAQDKNHDSWNESVFEPGEQVYMFGNNVKLRSAPKMESEVLELLKIGEWVQIIEKTEFSWPYRGYDSPFYKVKYDDKVGYILGGLLSIEKKVLNGIDFYFAFSKEGSRNFLNIRNVINGDYLEQKVPLTHTNITIHPLDNKGVPDLDGILFVNYIAEACGVEGGGIYLFAHGKGLTKVAELSEISDSGVFYRSERFIFPDEQEGIPNKILLKKEQRENLDEASVWTKTFVETRQLTWVDEKLVPDYQ
ncbi:SH3 domain-containing protein [Flagellimonas pacifica]|uniref:SH3 domain-containing protein n=1 Tax=Flagellimonas pacifica TaxID=1247520 RepID=A0A285M4X0_9FLAO|nr:SH3 domain-containing protein [Allomuricauda parva]SNY92232.1 SH3 domain-containing protein [Allomuricauda parva]